MRTKTTGGFGCGVIIFIWLLSFVVGIFCWPYAIETVALMLGKTVTVAWWQGGLIGLVPALGQFSIPVAVIVWIVSLFVL